MKIYRYIQNYKVEILDQPFELESDINFKKTAKIAFYDINNNLIETKKYGVVDPQFIYNKIINKESIDISRCYVKNFSLSDFRSKNNLNAREKVDLIDFTAVDSIFESEKMIDFTLGNFIGKKANFSNTHFGLEISFLKSEFGDLKYFLRVQVIVKEIILFSMLNLIMEM